MSHTGVYGVGWRRAARSRGASGSGTQQSLSEAPNLAGTAKLVPLAALGSQGPYPVQYLRLLVFQGKLRAVRDGRLWLSSRKWLDDYIANRDTRGRASKRTAGAPKRRRS